MAAVSLNSNLAALRAKRRLTRAAPSSHRPLNVSHQARRINHASDDAAGLAVSSTLNATARIHTQAARNVNEGISFLNVADGATSALKDILFRLRSFQPNPPMARSATRSGSQSIRSRRRFRPNMGGFWIARATTASASSGVVTWWPKRGSVLRRRSW